MQDSVIFATLWAICFVLDSCYFCITLYNFPFSPYFLFPLSFYCLHIFGLWMHMIKLFQIVLILRKIIKNENGQVKFPCFIIKFTMVFFRSLEFYECLFRTWTYGSKPMCIMKWVVSTNRIPVITVILQRKNCDFMTHLNSIWEKLKRKFFFSKWTDFYAVLVTQNLIQCEDFTFLLQ